jgi:3-deoxy-7-phosphoheptulonate synthase
MAHQTDDLRIQAVRPLIPAAILLEELPATSQMEATVAEARRAVDAALRGDDPRLVVVVGPCSIHDIAAAKEYAGRLREAAERHKDDLIVVMRSYFEKPRTTVGWKGLVNDPFLDGSFRVNAGLRLARSFLVHLAELGLPAATEFLDTTLPQHLADLISWGAIGARTTESQSHREMASGLSMPIGFKNATDGSVRVAIDAVLAAREPHWFAGATKDGVSALLQTTGNSSGHIILRGGSRTGPNYDEAHVREASETLAKEGLPHRVMVDLSHGNSSKNHLRQIEVAQDIAAQLGKGDSPIFGVMVESNLVEGRQNLDGPLTYGQSVTDACLSFEQTEPLLETLARAR